MKIKQVSISFFEFGKKMQFFLTKQQTKFCTRKYNMKLNFQVLCVFFFKMNFYPTEKKPTVKS